MTLYLILLAGMAMIALGLHLGRRSLDLVTNGVRTEGQIVDLIYRRSRQDEAGSFVPIVRFLDTTGRAITFRSGYSSSTAAFWLGQSVDVIYDEAAPERAMMNKVLALWAIPATLLIMGALLSGTGAGALAGMIEVR